MIFLRSLGFAFTGLRLLITTQRHARFHLAATLAVAGLAAWLRLPAAGWLWLVMAAALVWMAEAFNTAIETLADRVTREQDPLIGRAKDLAAGAVLVASAAALLIGAVVLAPPLLARSIDAP